MKTPLVTVLMPAYNAEKYIREAITSLLGQTFEDFELLIINDGSTDETKQIIESFTDPRIRLINQTNQGVAAALNMGLLNAKAELIARFDADDICMPDRLQKQIDFINEHSGYVLVGSNAVYVDKDGDFVFNLEYPGYTNEEIQALPVDVCAFSHVTVLYKKQAVIEAGLYDVNAHTFEDHLLWNKLMEKGKVCNLKDILVKVRFSPESITIDDKWRGSAFRKLKQTGIRKGVVNPEEGERILSILRRQNTSKVKKGAYYSLLAKKFLFNNYNVIKARENINRLIQTCPTKMQGYFFYGLSLLPRSFLQALYKIK